MNPKVHFSNVVNKGHARNTKESKEEKKARKEAIKQERRERRQTKKSFKTAFKSEKERQSKLLPNEKFQEKKIAL
jgi:protein LTV1